MSRRGTRVAYHMQGQSLTVVSTGFRRKLLEERDAARRDSRLKARCLSNLSAENSIR